MTAREPPWKRPRPKGAGKTALTADEKERARRSAERAGRRYPNLVDNLKILRLRRKPKG